MDKKDYKTSEAQRKANAKWDKANKYKFKRFEFKCVKGKDDEIISILENQKNKTEFIKQAIKNYKKI